MKILLVCRYRRNRSANNWFPDWNSRVPCALLCGARGEPEVSFMQPPEEVSDGRVSPHQHSDYVPCHLSRSLSHQHVAGRWARAANFARHCHHNRHHLHAEISRRILEKRCAQSFVTRSLSAFPITLIDERPIAAAPMMGDSKIPKIG